MPVLWYHENKTWSKPQRLAKKNIKIGEVKATVQDSCWERLIINTSNFPSLKSLKMFNQELEAQEGRHTAEPPFHVAEEEAGKQRALKAAGKGTATRTNCFWLLIPPERVEVLSSSLFSNKLWSEGWKSGSFSSCVLIYELKSPHCRGWPRGQPKGWPSTCLKAQQTTPNREQNCIIHQ